MGTVSECVGVVVDVLLDLQRVQLLFDCKGQVYFESDQGQLLDELSLTVLNEFFCILAQLTEEQMEGGHFQFLYE